MSPIKHFPGHAKLIAPFSDVRTQVEKDAPKGCKDPVKLVANVALPFEATAFPRVFWGANLFRWPIFLPGPSLVSGLKPETLRCSKAE